MKFAFAPVDCFITGDCKWCGLPQFFLYFSEYIFAELVEPAVDPNEVYINSVLYGRKHHAEIATAVVFTTELLQAPLFVFRQGLTGFAELGPLLFQGLATGPAICRDDYPTMSKANINSHEIECVLE